MNSTHFHRDIIKNEPPNDWEVYFFNKIIKSSQKCDFRVFHLPYYK